MENVENEPPLDGFEPPCQKQRILKVLVRFDTVLVRFTAVAVVANRGAP